jgi:hypothetical protein
MMPALSQNPKMELIRSLAPRLQDEVNSVRIIAEDLLTTRDVTDVILTRLETHAVKLELYVDLLKDSLGPRE